MNRRVIRYGRQRPVLLGDKRILEAQRRVVRRVGIQRTLFFLDPLYFPRIDRVAPLRRNLHGSGFDRQGAGGARRRQHIVLRIGSQRAIHRIGVGTGIFLRGRVERHRHAVRQAGGIANGMLFSVVEDVLRAGEIQIVLRVNLALANLPYRGIVGLYVLRVDAVETFIVRNDGGNASVSSDILRPNPAFCCLTVLRVTDCENFGEVNIRLLCIVKVQRLLFACIRSRRALLILRRTAAPHHIGKINLNLNDSPCKCRNGREVRKRIIPGRVIDGEEPRGIGVPHGGAVALVDRHRHLGEPEKRNRLLFSYILVRSLFRPAATGEVKGLFFNGKLTRHGAARPERQNRDFDAVAPDALRRCGELLPRIMRGVIAPIARDDRRARPTIVFEARLLAVIRMGKRKREQVCDRREHGALRRLFPLAVTVRLGIGIQKIA